MRLFSWILRLCGWRRMTNVRALAKALGVITVLAIVLYTAVPAAHAAPVTAPLPPDCTAIQHHTLSAFVAEYMAAGAGYAWQQSRTNSVIYAVQVAECGGMWLIAIWRSGNFQTNFFPQIENWGKLGFRELTRRAWAYIANNVRGFKSMSVGGAIYWPFHWVRVGPGTWDGCWVDNISGFAAPWSLPSGGIDWCTRGGLR